MHVKKYPRLLFIAILALTLIAASPTGTAPIFNDSWVLLVEQVKPAVVVVKGEIIPPAAPVYFEHKMHKNGILRLPVLILEKWGPPQIQSALRNPVLILGEEKTHPLELRAEKLGTGTVIHPDGFVLTNFHVVSGVQNPTVTFSDGKMFNADIMATKESYDAAILKIRAPEGTLFPYLPVASGSTLKQGALSLQLGHPYGLRFNASLGVIAALHPEKDLQSDVIDSSIIFRVSGTFPPGSSGSPVLNQKGETMGIIFASFSDSHFPGLALLAEKITKEFMAQGVLPNIP